MKAEPYVDFGNQQLYSLWNKDCQLTNSVCVYELGSECSSPKVTEQAIRIVLVVKLLW